MFGEKNGTGTNGVEMEGALGGHKTEGTHGVEAAEEGIREAERGIGGMTSWQH